MKIIRIIRYLFKTSFFYHSILWIIYLLLSTGVMGAIYNGIYPDPFDYFLLSISKIFIFYSSAFFIINFRKNKNILASFITILLILFVYYLLLYSRVLIAKYLEPNFFLPDYNNEISSFILAYIPNLVTFTSLGSLYWLYNDSKKQNKEKLELEKRNYEMEVSFLKSQINQHFIYNMLNMFYVNTMQYSHKLANGLLSLSELMRFSVSHEQNSLIPVLEELKYIESYIQLNQLRFDGKLLVNINTSGNLELYKIPHLCILTLVENAFKHGDLKKEPLEIKIDANEIFLTIYIKNKKRTAVIDKSTGIGLNNLERRLSLLLKDKFVLETKEENDFFISLLTIKN